jgi:RsiW-degrading membrane proteinase PrsW (M82 family)
MDTLRTAIQEIFINLKMEYFVALLPVLLFLLVLIYMDSFKLIKKKVLIITILWGVFCALLSFYFNNLILASFNINNTLFLRLVSPFVEESLKASLLVLLVLKSRIGFRIDAAIYGFAIGAGFALYENIFFINELQTENIWIWIIRGFGTAIMHGGSTSVFGVVLMNCREKGSGMLRYFIIGWLIAVVIHSLYNHFLLPPVISMFSVLIVVSVVEIALFQVNERLLRAWLELEFDSEVKLLSMIKKGEFSQTHAGKYLMSIRKNFSDIVVFDMLAYVSLYLDLSIKAKSKMMLKEAGFITKKDIEIKKKLNEISFLEKSIGKTGLLAVTPILRVSKKNLIKWSLS